MEYSEYREQDGVGLARLIRDGQVSPSEVLEAAIERSLTVNPTLNAVVTPMYDTARRRLTRLPDGPLSGVPFLLKDLFQDYAGIPTLGGSRAMAGVVPPEHSEITRRWLAAGLVVMGRTNVPELGVKGVSESRVYGPARNPWNTRHTPGGSSGGSAAAVAAGIVPVAGANDGAGSIRIPASHCGLFGLKPGRGLIPLGPRFTDLLGGSVVNGVVSRTVRDTAAALQCVLGPEPGARFVVAPPPLSFVEETRRDPGRLRIGFSLHAPLGGPDQEAVLAVENAARSLADLGHDVEPAAPAINGEALTGDFITAYLANLAALTAGLSAEYGVRDTVFEQDTRMIAAAGRQRGLIRTLIAMQRFDEYAAALDAFHTRYDLLLTPTVTRAAPRVGEHRTPWWQDLAGRLALRLRAGHLIAATGMIEHQVRRHLAVTPYTFLANITGRPAMTVPLHRTATGLPLGVQFTAANTGEGLLFRLAAQLEQAHPWSHHQPPL